MAHEPVAHLTVRINHAGTEARVTRCAFIFGKQIIDLHDCAAQTQIMIFKAIIEWWEANRP